MIWKLCGKTCVSYEVEIITATENGLFCSSQVVGCGGTVTTAWWWRFYIHYPLYIDYECIIGSLDMFYKHYRFHGCILKAFKKKKRKKKNADGSRSNQIIFFLFLAGGQKKNMEGRGGVRVWHVEICPKSLNIYPLK